MVGGPFGASLGAYPLEHPIISRSSMCATIVNIPFECFWVQGYWEECFSLAMLSKQMLCGQWGKDLIQHILMEIKDRNCKRAKNLVSVAVVSCRFFKGQEFISNLCLQLCEASVTFCRSISLFLLFKQKMALLQLILHQEPQLVIPVIFNFIRGCGRVMTPRESGQFSLFVFRALVSYPNQKKLLLEIMENESECAKIVCGWDCASLEMKILGLLTIDEWIDVVNKTRCLDAATKFVKHFDINDKCKFIMGITNVIDMSSDVVNHDGDEAIHSGNDVGSEETDSDSDGGDEAGTEVKDYLEEHPDLENWHCDKLKIFRGMCRKGTPYEQLDSWCVIETLLLLFKDSRVATNVELDYLFDLAHNHSTMNVPPTSPRENLTNMKIRVLQTYLATYGDRWFTSNICRAAAIDLCVSDSQEFHHLWSNHPAVSSLIKEQPAKYLQFWSFALRVNYNLHSFPEYALRNIHIPFVEEATMNILQGPTERLRFLPSLHSNLLNRILKIMTTVPHVLASVKPAHLSEFPKGFLRHLDIRFHHTWNRNGRSSIDRVDHFLDRLFINYDLLRMLGKVVLKSLPTVDMILKEIPSVKELVETLGSFHKSLILSKARLSDCTEEIQKILLLSAQTHTGILCLRSFLTENCTSLLRDSPVQHYKFVDDIVDSLDICPDRLMRIVKKFWEHDNRGRDLMVFSRFLRTKKDRDMLIEFLALESGGHGKYKLLRHNVSDLDTLEYWFERIDVV